MTLARGSIGGYEYDRMVLKFSMLDGAREVPCAVSASAMDDLERVRADGAGASARSSSSGCATGSNNARRANSRRRSSRARLPASFCAASIFATERLGA